MHYSLLTTDYRLFHCRLGGGESGDGDSERRAGDVVQSGAVAEVNAVGVAAVFAADADLQFFSGLSAELGPHLD